jgi:hypothetical protein
MTDRLVIPLALNFPFLRATKLTSPRAQLFRFETPTSFPRP